jgi:hypothetical protein
MVPDDLQRGLGKRPFECGSAHRRVLLLRLVRSSWFRLLRAGRRRMRPQPAPAQQRDGVRSGLAGGPACQADQQASVTGLRAAGSESLSWWPGHVRDALPGVINAWWTDARSAARPLGRATGSAGTVAPRWGPARGVVSQLSRATGSATRAGTHWPRWRRPHRDSWRRPRGQRWQADRWRSGGCARCCSATS